jgi:hypothetical protein
MAKRFLVLIALLMLGFFIAGCAEGDKSATVVNPNPNVFTPTGSISGVVYDVCKEAPVQGAVISVAYAGGVHQVTTAANGAFSFNGVPAVEGNGSTNDWEAENDVIGYTVTCDLTKVSGYGYALINEVEVVYSDLGDGTNNDLASGTTEGGSGASTPVNGLAATTEFDVSALTSTIKGTVIDITTGRAATGATIALYFDGRLMGAPVVSTDGTFTFANVPASSGDDFTLVVTKAGYDYVTLIVDGTPTVVGKKISGDNPNSCGIVSINCPVACSDTLSGIEVDLVANPAKDITVPYIVSVAAGGQTDIITGDSFETLTNADITSIVFTFDEAMKADRTLTSAVNLTSSFTVVVTSAGPLPTGATAVTATRSGIEIINDFEIVMTSAGVMTITPAYDTTTQIIAAANAEAGLGFALTNATVVIGAGSYTVDFLHSTYPGSGHLTDANLVPWYIGTPGLVDAHGFFHSTGEVYQDLFILGGGHAITFGVEAVQ